MSLLDFDEQTKDVYFERLRAVRKHLPAGNSVEDKPWNWHKWLPVLTEEVGEVARVLCDSNEYDPHLRAELVQVAAMALAWLDACDRHEWRYGA